MLCVVAVHPSTITVADSREPLWKGVFSLRVVGRCREWEEEGGVELAPYLRSFICYRDSLENTLSYHWGPKLRDVKAGWRPCATNCEKIRALYGLLRNAVSPYLLRASVDLSIGELKLVRPSRLRPGSRSVSTDLSVHLSVYEASIQLRRFLSYRSKLTREREKSK